jgi:glucose/arabinose dehydrogenase
MRMSATNTPPDSALPLAARHSDSPPTAPLLHWTPSIGPSGMAFYTGDLFAGWKGQLLVGGLARPGVYRLELAGEKVRRVERMLDQIGRVRDLRQGPDGSVYLLIDSPTGTILRLRPR